MNANLGANALAVGSFYNASAVSLYPLPACRGMPISACHEKLGPLKILVQGTKICRPGPKFWSPSVGIGPPPFSQSKCITQMLSNTMHAMLLLKADPNSTTGLKFHKNFCLGDRYFCGILIPWTKFFRTEIPPRTVKFHTLIL